MSRTDTIQTLFSFVSFLGWVRVGDGNYELCQKLKNAIQKIMDHVLESLVPASAERDETNALDYADTGVNQLPSAGMDLSEEDWISLLNTYDWTQGIGLEAI